MPWLRWARSLVPAWVALLAIACGVEGPLLHWTAPFFGPAWTATAHLAFDCLALAAAGWVAGRCNRPQAIVAAALFAVTISFWDFGGILGLNVPWLLHLIWNCLHDSRYIDSLASSLEAHVLLFGCLFTGAALSRPREKPLSIGPGGKE